MFGIFGSNKSMKWSELFGTYIGILKYIRNNAIELNSKNAHRIILSFVADYLKKNNLQIDTVQADDISNATISYLMNKSKIDKLLDNLPSSNSDPEFEKTYDSLKNEFSKYLIVMAIKAYD